MRILKASVVSVVMAIVLLGLYGEAWAPPINGISARTFFAFFTLGISRIRWTQLNSLEREGSDVPDPLKRRVTVLTESYTQVYGLTRDLTLALTIPQVEKMLEFRSPVTGQTVHLTSSGLGDITASGTYRFYRKDLPIGSNQASAIFGVKAPTGSTDKASKRALLLPGVTSDKIPLPLQPGRGLD